MVTIWHDPLWSTPDGNAPPSTPLCGFANEFCPPVIEGNVNSSDTSDHSLLQTCIDESKNVATNVWILK